MRFVLAMAMLSCSTLLAAAQDPKSPDREPGKIYLQVQIKGKTTIREAPTWSPLRVLDLREKITGFPTAILVDDISVAPCLIRKDLATDGLGKPIEGEVGFAILVTVHSADADRKQHFTPWTKLSVTDDKKNKYDQLFFAKPSALSASKGKKVRIDESPTTDVIFFERPVAAAKEFFLEFPGENVGLKANLKFRFTDEDIKDAIGK